MEEAVTTTGESLVVTLSTFADAKDAYRSRELRQSLYDEGEVIMADVLVNLHGTEHRARRRAQPLHELGGGVGDEQHRGGELEGVAHAELEQHVGLDQRRGERRARDHRDGHPAQVIVLLEDLLAGDAHDGIDRISPATLRAALGR